MGDFFVSSKPSALLAHVRQDDIGQWQPHLLDEHLRGVAVLTESISPFPLPGRSALVNPHMARLPCVDQLLA
jgi:hypothetical protein